MKKLFFCILMASVLHSAAQIKFTNPVLSGFYPDPSVTKVGADHYLVNSTFAYFPGIPVFHSKDLKNWKQIGNVIDRPTQMNFLGDRVTRGLFAPSINFHNGLYYVTCTLIDHQGNFVVTAKNPAGPWSDPVWLPEVKGIDPSLFFDRNKAYIVYNSEAPANKPLYRGHRTIRVYEFDPVNLKVLGDEVQLVNGGVDISKKPVWIEGPHIFKRGNWYYLCAAEGGTSVNHSQVFLRSQSATGPYVPFEKNPILTQRDLDPNRKNPITSAGHAELIEGPDGKTYAVFLAVRPYEGDYYNTGRETFIAPVKWENDWPIINPDSKELKFSYTAGFEEIKQADARPQSGNFSYRIKFEKQLDPALLFLRTMDSSWFRLNKSSGLTMKLLPETIMGTRHPAFIGKRQQHLTAKASTALIFNAKSKNEKAGITIFQNESHFYYLCKSKAGGKPVLQVFKGTKDQKEMELLKQIELNSALVYLKIEANRDKYNFSYATSPKQWKLLLRNADGKFLSTKEAGGFVGSLFALYATSSGEKSVQTANFEWLDYEGNDISF